MCMSNHLGLVAQVLRSKKSLSLSAIPSPRLASSIANFGVENCEINQRGTSENVSHSPVHANPNIKTLFILAICQICLSQEWCTGSDSATAICWNQCVWQRKMLWRQHWCYERWNTEYWANLGIHFLALYVGGSRPIGPRQIGPWQIGPPADWAP